MSTCFLACSNAMVRLARASAVELRSRRRSILMGSGGRSGKLEVLLMGVHPPGGANTIADHLGSFGRYSRHRIYFLQNQRPLREFFGRQVGTFPKWLNLDRFDVLVIHYSNYLPGELHFDAEARNRIRNFKGLKVLFLQDEYREINTITTRIRELGIDVLFTCLPEDEIDKVYPAERLPGLTRINTLTGFVPEDLVPRDVPRIALRPIDVGYRSRKVPYWLGDLGREKWEIVPKFLAATAGSGLVLDLSYQEHDRIYGAAWVDFVASCKTMLGTESGASVFDFTGEIQRAVQAYLTECPKASFDDVSERFLRPHEGRIRLNQISPRCFEAAALRTVMVLYEGRYSNVLEPWRHFIPLRKDFGNVDEVLHAIRDTVALQMMADRAYHEVARDPRYSYRAFVGRFDAVIEGERRDRGKRRAQRGSGLVDESLVFRLTVRAVGLTLGFAAIRLTALGYRMLVPRVLRRRLRPFTRKLASRHTELDRIGSGAQHG
jgi:hypothetical protein